MHDDADDLIQDTCVKLVRYQRAHELLHPDAFFLRSHRNLAIDVHRVRRNHGQALLLGNTEAETPGRGLGVSPTEDTVLDGERMPGMIVILESLHALTHELFVEQPFEGLSYREFAPARGSGFARCAGMSLSKAMVVPMCRMEGW